MIQAHAEVGDHGIEFELGLEISCKLLGGALPYVFGSRVVLKKQLISSVVDIVIAGNPFKTRLKLSHLAALARDVKPRCIGYHFRVVASFAPVPAKFQAIDKNFVLQKPAAQRRAC